MGVDPFDIRRSGEDPEEARREGCPERDHYTRHTERDPARIMRRRIADELGHEDQRPRRRLGQPEAVHHLARLQPAVSRDDVLPHIGQHGIGSAEGDNCQLGKEPAKRRQQMIFTKHRRQSRKRNEPYREPCTDCPQRCPRRCCDRGRRLA